MSYRRFGNHWIVINSSGEIICHCDSEQECREEIMNMSNALRIGGENNE